MSEAQQLQDEAIRTQESLTRQLERQRQLKRRAKKLEVAKMVTSVLKENITQGLRLSNLTHPHQWVSGLDFLHQPPDQWPTMPTVAAEVYPDSAEPRPTRPISVPHVEGSGPGTVTSLHGAAASSDRQTVDATAYISAGQLTHFS